MRRTWKKAIRRFSSSVLWVSQRSGKPVSVLTSKAEPHVAPSIAGGGADGNGGEGGGSSCNLLRGIASPSAVPGGSLPKWKCAHGSRIASTRAKAGWPSGPRAAKLAKTARPQKPTARKDPCSGTCSRRFFRRALRRSRHMSIIVNEGMMLHTASQAKGVLQGVVAQASWPAR